MSENNPLVDFGSMSDEEFLTMAAPGSDSVPLLGEEFDEGEEHEEQHDEAQDEVNPEATGEEEDEEDFEDESDEDGEEIEADEAEETTLVDEELDNDPFEAEGESVEDEESEAGSEDTSDIMQKVLAPFKANGKEIKVDNIEDLRRLAQMGAGYNAKMQELKPVRKIAQTLKQAGLLNEDKINFLIDLSKGDKGAINRLVKENGIDPIDIDVEDDGYTPNSYTVSESQFALDEALDELERSSSGKRTIEIISTKMDAKSKQRLVNDMDAIHALKSQVENGIYDKIMGAVEVQRMLGNIPLSISDLDAYNQVGQQLAQAGAFNTSDAKAPETNKAPDKKKAKAKSDKKRNAKRKAASAPRKRKPSKAQPDSFLGMSDEDFMKQFGN